jgi:hypothetical protein
MEPHLTAVRHPSAGPPDGLVSDLEVFRSDLAESKKLVQEWGKSDLSDLI